MNQKQPSDDTQKDREDWTDRSNAPDFPAAEREMTTETADGSKDTMHGRTGHSAAQTSQDLTDRSGAPDFAAVEQETKGETEDRAPANVARERSAARHATETEDWSDRSIAPETPARDERG